ncbi:hypothetical protein COOONC_08921 [Cooperia oncophora]
MHEGRPATVRLLDGEFLEISVIARLSVNDVLTLAAHHCRITQPDARFFGLAFIDDKFNGTGAVQATKDPGGE